MLTFDSASRGGIIYRVRWGRGLQRIINVSGDCGVTNDRRLRLTSPLENKANVTM